MTTNPNDQPMMEIPVAEYEALIASCAAWRTWADGIHLGLTSGEAPNSYEGEPESIKYWVVKNWFDRAIQPQTDKEGILLKQLGKDNHDH
ncbi:hypothetical protein LCGC14_0353130 [marine sediment metagenome]|uniref:Uncharacterized protein n=1 Tax=marine sediment metagenome TaxID=412755 RepID=A0A0F9VX92_9ZZZZ